jgi:5'(3')-deoxyribonucleotidase
LHRLLPTFEWSFHRRPLDLESAEAPPTTHQAANNTSFAKQSDKRVRAAVASTAYRAEDWSDWDLTFLPPGDGKLLFQLFTPDLYDIVVPYPQAPESVNALSKVPGVQLVCVTSDPQENAEPFTEAKRHWLRRHIPELSGKLIAARNKFWLGLDILVDDAPHHHEMADCATVLVRRPWNRDVRCPLEFSHWTDGLRVLSQLISDFERSRHERANYVR